MRKLLFISHRLPFPPDKGEKIRAWHMLQRLARHFEIHLACLSLSGEEAAAAQSAELTGLCASVAAPLASRGARLRGTLAGLRPGRPLMPAYYHLPALQRRIDTLRAAHDFDAIVIYTVAMAPYVLGYGRAALPPRPRIVLDAVDIDSEKWADYAATAGFPQNLFWAREARTLLAYERRVAARAHATLFVSDAEAARFVALAPECAARVRAVGNGVDLAYFDPAQGFASPYRPGTRNLLFSGTMNYWPNVDAVQWFAQEILPGLCARHPDLQFTIAGADPADAVKALAANPRITVTGRVADMRPYLAHADAAVAPLRIARGIQNKVLEAMSMARPVVATEEAATGILAGHGQDLLVADGAAPFAAAIGAILRGDYPKLGEQARAAVERSYSWEHQLSPLEALVLG